MSTSMAFDPVVQSFPSSVKAVGSLGFSSSPLSVASVSTSMAFDPVVQSFPSIAKAVGSLDFLSLPLKVAFVSVLSTAAMATVVLHLTRTVRHVQNALGELLLVNVG